MKLRKHRKEGKETLKMEENKIVIGWVRLSEEEKQNNGANYASVTGHVLLERLIEQ